MSNRIYGIKNCDTMKKSFSWLDNHGITYQFHDYKTIGIDEKTLRKWIKKVSWEKLINRRGMTWRKLNEKQKSQLTEEKAISLMISQPTLIKRPLIDTGKVILLGFDAKEYEQTFQ